MYFVYKRYSAFFRDRLLAVILPYIIFFVNEDFLILSRYHMMFERIIVEL